MFSKARIKITCWYTLIIMFISSAFSLVIFKTQSDEMLRFARAQRFLIERRLRELPFPVAPVLILDTDLIAESKHRLILALVVLNTGILVAAAGLAYMLAGRTLAPIKEMVDEQNRFISDASHELRTPLTALKTSMEVHLRDKKLVLADARKLIADSVTEVDRLKQLSDGLLQLTSYQKGNNNMKVENIDFKQVVDDAIESVKLIADQKNITIERSLTNAEMTGIRYSIKDLLVILLDNAIKYSPDGKTIQVDGGIKDGYILLTIKDFGVGIAETDLPHIFDRFYRADTARTKTAASGYGLGLAIAKKIVDLHKGDIGVTSKVGEGTTFSLKLPRKQVFS